jgi:hypothetical protein
MQRYRMSGRTYIYDSICCFCYVVDPEKGYFKRTAWSSARR